MAELLNNIDTRGLLDTSAATKAREHTEYLNDMPWHEREPITKRILGELACDVLPTVASRLEEMPGRIHPSGFQVYSFGEVTQENVGSCRLHIWPKGPRRRQKRGFDQIEDGLWDGDIHDHAWFVTSLNITGYKDRLYEVSEMGNDISPDEVAAKGLFHRFRVQYLKDGRDALTTAGWTVDTSELEYRDNIQDGEFHTILPEVYHAPTIPDDKFAATLVINSPRIPPRLEEHETPFYDGLSNTVVESPNILIRGTNEPIVGVRQEVTLEEKLLAKEQLTDALRHMPSH